MQISIDEEEKFAFSSIIESSQESFAGRFAFPLSGKKHAKSFLVTLKKKWGKMKWKFATYHP